MEEHPCIGTTNGAFRHVQKVSYNERKRKLLDGREEKPEKAKGGQATTSIKPQCPKTSVEHKDRRGGWRGGEK